MTLKSTIAKAMPRLVSAAAIPRTVKLPVDGSLSARTPVVSRALKVRNWQAYERQLRNAVEAPSCATQARDKLDKFSYFSKMHLLRCRSVISVAGRIWRR